MPGNPAAVDLLGFALGDRYPALRRAVEGGGADGRREETAGVGPRRFDDGSVEVEALFDDLFDEAPPTDPTVPTVPELDEEVTLEVPAAAAAAGINPRARVGAEVEAESEVEAEAPAFFAPILPEMEAEIWQAGIQALVTVPERADPPATSHDDWMEEARLFQAESNSAETPVLAAGLLTAAARAAEVAGEAAEAASGYDEALARAPTAPDALRARARLAESVGDIDEAHALWARLAISAGTAEERAFYGALSAEWTLARRGALPAVAGRRDPRRTGARAGGRRGGVARRHAGRCGGGVRGGRARCSAAGSARRFSSRRLASPSWRATPRRPRRTGRRRASSIPIRSPTSARACSAACARPRWTDRRGGGQAARPARPPTSTRSWRRCRRDRRWPRRSAGGRRRGRAGAEIRRGRWPS